MEPKDDQTESEQTKMWRREKLEAELTEMPTLEEVYKPIETSIADLAENHRKKV